MKRMQKKGQVLNGLGALGIGIASFTILIAVIFLVLAQVSTQIASVNNAANVSADQSVGQNATRTMTNAVADIPGWIPLIVIVAIGGLILGMVAVFGGRR